MRFNVAEVRVDTVANGFVRSNRIVSGSVENAQRGLSCFLDENRDTRLGEGWFLGSSTGINVCGAAAVAQKLGPGHTIVTVLCDGGGKYQSRLFNKSFLEEQGLRTR